MLVNGKIIKSATFHVKPYYTFLSEMGIEYQIDQPSMPPQGVYFMGHSHIREINNLNVKAIIVEYDKEQFAKVINE